MHQYPVTARQKEVLNTIIRLTAERDGVGPSYQEVARELKVTYRAVKEIVERLVERGHMRTLPRSARSMQVITQRESRA